MLHEEFAPASRPRTESLFPSPPNRAQSVSQSLSPVPYLRLSCVLPSMFSLVPCPLVHPFTRLPSLSAISIRPLFSSLFSLSPSYSRIRTHTKTSFSFMQPSIAVVVFWLTHYYSFSIVPSVLHAACRHHSLFLSPFRTANDRAPIHPSDFSLSHFLSNSTTPSVAPFICLPSPTAFALTISTTYLTSRASFRRLYLKH